MMYQAFKTLIIYLFILLLPLNAFAKIWTDTSGRKLDAELVQYKDNWIQLRLPDGTLRPINVDQLCPDDREYIFHWISEKKKAEQSNSPQQVEQPRTALVRKPENSKVSFELTEAQVKEWLRQQGIIFASTSSFPPATSAIQFVREQRPDGKSMLYYQIGFRSGKFAYIKGDYGIDVERFFQFANMLISSRNKKFIWKIAPFQLDIFPPLGSSNIHTPTVDLGKVTRGNLTIHYIGVFKSYMKSQGMRYIVEQSNGAALYCGFYHSFDTYPVTKFEYIEKPFVATAEAFWEWTLQEIGENTGASLPFSTSDIDRFSYERSLSNFINPQIRQQIMNQRFLYAYLYALHNEGVPLDVLVKAAQNRTSKNGPFILDPRLGFGKEPNFTFATILAKALTNKKINLRLETRIRLLDVLVELKDSITVADIEKFLDTINKDNLELRDHIAASLEKIQ